MFDIKEKQRKITINEFPQEIPDFASSYEPKDSVIKKWIINWILSSVKSKKIKENDILPNKTELSKYLGVSVGTVQNAIRYVEDEGYLKSKQRLGTMINGAASNPITKSTSKRDKAILAVKHYIISNNYKVGSPIIPARKLADKLDISQNTARLAYEYLASIGIIESKQIRGNDSNWVLKQIPQIQDDNQTAGILIESETLVTKITADLKEFLGRNFKVGDKIPSHEELSQKFNVSVKTIHDSISNLCNEAILISRRGRYGTVLAQNPLSNVLNRDLQEEIFAKSADASIYSYKKVESQIINMIKSEFKPDDKLPSMSNLAKRFDVSTNTIRKALNSIAAQGYLTFSRGRFGGTFLIDNIDDNEKEAYQWISINPSYIQNNQ